MPNLRGASPVGRDGGGRSYAARTDGGEESGRRRSGSGDVLGKFTRGNGAQSGYGGVSRRSANQSGRE